MHNFILFSLQARVEIVLESKNKYVYCRPCDLAKLESVRKFVEIFKMGIYTILFSMPFLFINAYYPSSLTGG